MQSDLATRTASGKRTRHDLHPYQRRSIGRLVAQKCIGLFLSPGLGKTAIALYAIAALKNTGQLKGPSVVITTPRIAATVWADEATLWDELSDLVVVPVVGAPKQRREALAAPADVYVISIHSMSDFIAAWRDLGRPAPGLVIVDESTLIKNPKSKRTRKVITWAQHAPRRWALTGSPAPNGLHELFSQVLFLDLGARFGTNFDDWQQRHFFRPHPESFRWNEAPGTRQKITDAMKNLVVSIAARDVLHELPRRVDIPVRVQMPQDAWRAYLEMDEDGFADIGDTTIEARNPAIVVGKLAQLASGFIFDGDQQAHHIHSAKIDAAIELVETTPGPHIIWSNFRPTMARLKAAFPQAEVLAEWKDPAKLVAAWNAGQIPILLGHPASGGHGLNLAKGGSIAIWVELPRSAELYAQAVARIDRQGQTEPVRNFIIEASDTIDALIFDILTHRIAGEDAMRAAWSLMRAERRNRDKPDAPDLRAMRRAAAMAHPDNGGGSADEFRRLWAAYQIALKGAEK